MSFCDFVNQHWNNYANSWQESSSNWYFAKKGHLLISTLKKKQFLLEPRQNFIQKVKIWKFLQNEKFTILLKQKVKILFRIPKMTELN